MEVAGVKLAIKPSSRMAGNVWKRLQQEYPEYQELRDLLSLAAVTWPRYGLSADSLSKMSDGELAMIRLLVGGGA